MALFKVKILVLGPTESGKSVLCNFLSEATEISSDYYHPTQGVRILEFERPNVSFGSRTTSVDVELWDCSGDRRFETCWPAFAKDTNGIMFVFNSDRPNHDKELDELFQYFVKQQGLKPNQCILLAHEKQGSPHQLATPASFRNIHCIQSNIEENGDQLHADFNEFLSAVLMTMSDKRDQEELSIMNTR